MQTMMNSAQEKAAARQRGRSRWAPMGAFERFMTHVEPITESGCHIWTGCTERKGHGIVNFEGRLLYSHRVIWERLHGAIPHGMCVCHKCDVPSCVNPYHLFLGTRKENNADMVKKGRQAKGEVKHLKLTSQKVIDIRRQLLEGKRVTSLARKFDVSSSTISNIKSRDTWKHI